MLTARSTRVFMASPTLHLSPAVRAPMLRSAARSCTMRKPHTRISASPLHSTATDSMSTNGNAATNGFSTSQAESGTANSIAGGFTTMGQLTPQQAADATRYQACVQAIRIAKRDRRRRFGSLAICFAILVVLAVVYLPFLGCDPVTKGTHIMNTAETITIELLQHPAGVLSLLRDGSIPAAEFMANLGGGNIGSITPLSMCFLRLMVGVTIITAPIYLVGLVTAAKCWAWFGEAQSRILTANDSLEELKSSCKLMWGHEYVRRLGTVFAK